MSDIANQIALGVGIGLSIAGLLFLAGWSAVLFVRIVVAA